MRLIIIFFTLLFNLSANETPWTGKWDMYWKDGSITMQLIQSGNSVKGNYYPYEGNFTGMIKENTLSGHYIQKNGQGELALTLSPNENSFFGTISDREWINGYRIDNTKRNQINSYDLSSPYTTLISFLKLGNSVRSGKHEDLAHAIKCIDMGEENEALPFHQRYLLAKLFFNVIDEHTIFTRNIPTQLNSTKFTYTIFKNGTDLSFELQFIKDAQEKWKLKMPSKSVLEKKMASLLKSRGVAEINPNAYLKLQSPRDTMRTFIEQIKIWDAGGKEHVIETLNMSHVLPKVREWEAPILAQYIKQVLDRTTFVAYQEIPNDPKSELVYTHYKHPLGNIVIAPFEVDGEIRWQFTPDTLKNISTLNEAMDNLPLKSGISELDNTSYFFYMRNKAKSVSSWLVTKLFYLEIWQWMAIAVLLFIAYTIGKILSMTTYALLKRLHFTKDLTVETMTLRFLRPMTLLTMALIWSFGLVYIGIPEFIFAILRLSGLLLTTISLAWLAYNLINLSMAVLHFRTSKTKTEVDTILVSLVGSTLKIVVIVGGLFAAADIISIPYQTVVAGLGIGGLAFAIAAKDTIANFFGSAIILADRPFVQGDEVKIGDYFGTVTHVGIRSTRIRTLDDTEVVIPNGQISNDIIDNYSKREYRRLNSKFVLDKDTDKETLDNLDKAILVFLENDKKVINKDILTGVQEYTIFGIEFGVTFYVDSDSKVDYSLQQHRLLSDIAKIIKDNGVKQVSIHKNIINK